VDILDISYTTFLQKNFGFAPQLAQNGTISIE